MERLAGTPYLVGDQLGRGPHGVVRAGADANGRPFAIKVLDRALTPETASLAQFDRWRDAALALRHEHVVAVHDLVLTADSLAIVSDRVDGGDLSQALAVVRTFPPAEACRIGAQLARGLAAVHAAGLVHGDLSSRNVLFDPRARRPSVLIGDVGLAGWLRHATGQQVPFGAHAYAAPEVVAGAAAAPTADLYALGVLLFEMCAGATPFVGDPPEVRRLQVEVAPLRPAGLPDRLWVLIAALLAKDPGSRPGPAGQVAAYLAVIAGAVAAVPPALAPLPPIAVPAPPAPPAPAAPVEPMDAVTAPRPRLPAPTAPAPTAPVVPAAVPPPAPFVPASVTPAPFGPTPPGPAPAGPPPVEVVTTVPSARARHAAAVTRARRGMLVAALAVLVPLMLIVGVRTLTGADPIADESAASVPGESGNDLRPDQYRGDVLPDAILPGPLASEDPTAEPAGEPGIEDQITSLADLTDRPGEVGDADRDGPAASAPRSSDDAEPAPVDTVPGRVQSPAAPTPSPAPSPRPTVTARPSAPATPAPTTAPAVTAEPSASATPSPSVAPTAASSTPSPEPGEG